MAIVEMKPPQVVLLACGSFNPPTIMHLRMFVYYIFKHFLVELARDYLHRVGKHTVIGGMLSPVHDDYGKKDLVNADHRRQMLKRALETSTWLHLSSWESTQNSWQRTRQVLNYHQFEVDKTLEESKLHQKQGSRLKSPFSWLLKTAALAANGNGFEPVKVKLLCGADLLESFHIPGLWSDEDVKEIVGGFGLVVITRHGSDAAQAIYKSDLLTKYEGNIDIVTEWITGDISSTKIRRCIRRGESVKYLVPDSVIEYIHSNALFSPSIPSSARPISDGETSHIVADESGGGASCAKKPRTAGSSRSSAGRVQPRGTTAGRRRKSRRGGGGRRRAAT
ncbi:unnamed protein product [Notodromas monacha]|uniref:Nicotinamide-nucleotide adenylyltransferase n=1 Tax=Notodromas monacha TaxID=399045 RepID=A0A7R9BNU9_9CRUS|nr:unnamed protein product [Notodromas monacha]CAG0917582.1 unnamed protein product [Notodromas monacha]